MAEWKVGLCCCGGMLLASPTECLRGAEVLLVCVVATRQRLVGVREALGKSVSWGSPISLLQQLPTPPLLSPQVLPCLLRPFSHVLYHLPLGTVTSLVQQLTNLPQSATAPAPTNLHLTAVLQNKVLPSFSAPRGRWDHPIPPQSWETEFPGSFSVLEGRAGCSRGAGTAQEPPAASPWRFFTLPLLINEGVWQINQPSELAWDSAAGWQPVPLSVPPGCGLLS